MQTKRFAKQISTLIILTSAMSLSYALNFSATPKQDVIGYIQYVHAQKGKRLSDIARRYEMGFYELIEANPDINRHSPISPNYSILIPSEFVLPNVPRKGIVINLPELRLYYFMKNGRVRTEPIAIGKFNWTTPTIQTKVIDKRKDPKWYVPKSIKASAARKGIFYPDVVAAGPKNPLGKFALKLADRSYLIHGTNNPSTIGKRASSGCMRMYPEDIATLFQAVPVGTPVNIIDEPFKLGWKNNKLYLEVHEPLYETAEPEHVMAQQVNAMIQKMTQGRGTSIDWQKVKRMLERPTGVPQAISRKVSYATRDYDNFYKEGPVVYGSVENVTHNLR